MAGQTVDTSAFQNAMKDDYFNGIITQLNDNQKLVKIFTKDVEGFESGGNQLIASIKTARNYAVRGVGDGGLLPSPKTPSYRKLTIPKRYVYGSTQISGPAIIQSQKSAASFAKAMDEISTDLVESIELFRERALCGWGRGILALVNGAGTNTTSITVDAPMGVAGSTNGVRFIMENMDVAIVDPVTTLPICIRTVSSVTDSTNTVTFNTAVSATDAPDNAYIVLATTDGSVIESSLDQEPMGLLGMVDDSTFLTTYFGVSRTTNPILKSTVIPSVGILTSMKLQRALDATEAKSGKMPDAHLMHHSIRREYLGVREADIRYQDDKMTPDIGYNKGAMDNAINYSKTPIIPISAMPYGYWFGVNKSSMVRTVDAEGEWINEDGAILSRLPNRDVFIANYRIFENYWCKQPNANFRLDGITATVDAFRVF